MRQLVPLVLLSLALASCGDSSAAPAPVASVAISAPPANVLVGQRVPLSATARNAQGTTLSGREVAWVSQNSAVAVVDGTGVVTGVAPGQTAVTATVEGITGSVTVVVAPVPVASVVISPAGDSLRVGDSRQLSATAVDSAGKPLSGRAVAWGSSDPTIVVVDGAGVARALAPGVATITATSEGKSGSVTLRATGVAVASVRVTPDSATLAKRGWVVLTATTRDAAGRPLSGRAIAWSSSNPGVATVDGSGRVTGVAPGVAVVTATSEGQSGSARVTVVPGPTPLFGSISGSVTLTRADSPYRLVADLYLLRGATVTVEPGAVIDGGDEPDYSIRVSGTLLVRGTAAERVVLRNVKVVPSGRTGELYRLEMDFVEMNGGRIELWSHDGGFGRLRLRDSIVRDQTGIIDLPLPIEDVYIERNVFVNSGGIRTITSGSAKVYIRNNSFYGQTGGYAVQNRGTSDASATVVELNSFWSTDRVAVALERLRPSARVEARNNYWGTTSEATIRTMISIGSDDLSRSGVVEYQPFLSAPHPDTPVR